MYIPSHIYYIQCICKLQDDNPLPTSEFGSAPELYIKIVIHNKSSSSDWLWSMNYCFGSWLHNKVTVSCASLHSDWCFASTTNKFQLSSTFGAQF